MLKSPANKGVALLISLALLLVVVILANAIIRVIWAHSRFTHHQASRIQAYYAGLGALNIGYQNVRKGIWGGSTGLCPSNTPCTQSPAGVPFYDYNLDADFWPSSIKAVSVAVVGVNPLIPVSGSPSILNFAEQACVNAPADVSECIVSTVNYTWTPS